MTSYVKIETEGVLELRTAQLQNILLYAGCFILLSTMNKTLKSV